MPFPHRHPADAPFQGAGGDAGVAEGIEGMSLEHGGGAGGGEREYDAPETTAPEGVEQGDYLNAQKARRQGGGRTQAV